jgi:hypothetical protein
MMLYLELMIKREAFTSSFLCENKMQGIGIFELSKYEKICSAEAA